jgi:two-component system chemotaxis response regulator CheY
VARVLIVDDEATDLAIIRVIVELMGHEVHLASDGEEAFKKYLRKDIDLVITDIEMPRVDGLEFIEALLGLYPDAKIIAASAGGPDRLHAAKRAGATVLLSKPVGPEQMGKAFEQAGFGSA